MPRRFVAAMLAALVAIAIPVGSLAVPDAVPPSTRAAREAHVRLVQVVEADDLGVTSLTGLAYAAESGVLIVAGSRASGDGVFVRSTPLGEVVGADIVDRELVDHGIVYDPSRDLIVGAAGAGTLGLLSAPSGVTTPQSARTSSVAAIDVAGLAVSASGDLLLLDPSGSVSNVGRPDRPSSRSTRVDLRADEALIGLAASIEGSLYALSIDGTTLYEFDGRGTPVATRDVSDAGIDTVAGMVLAPSADPTDDPTKESLYVADSGLSEDAAGIYEFELQATPLDVSVQAATTGTATLVRTIQTANLSPSSPDPSGMAYNPTADRLVMVDGEIEEENVNPYTYPGANGWVFPRDGSSTTSTIDLTNDECRATGSLRRNREPVGIARNPTTGTYYVSNDQTNLIWELNASFSPVRCFRADTYGVADAEGIAFGNGNLFIADGTGAEIWRIAPGGDGTFGTADDGVTHFDTAGLGQPDPEGVEFDAASGNLFVVSNQVGSTILEVTPTGTPVRELAVSGVTLDSARGMTLAPGTTGTDVRAYVADAMEDNNDNAGAFDGRIYELAFQDGGTTPPPEPDTTITAGPSGTVTSTDASFSFTGSAGTDSFECQLDAGGFSACTSPQTYTGLALGSHTFEVRALDGSTADPTPATRTWTIEDGGTTPPPGGTPLVEHTEVQAVSGTTWTITAPAAAGAGDLLYVTFNANAGSGVLSLSPPAGWSQAFDADAAAGLPYANGWQEAWYLVVPSDGAATHSFATSLSRAGRAHVYVIEAGSFDATDPIEAVAYAPDTTTDTTWSVPAVDAAGGALLIASAASAGTGPSWTPDPAYTEGTDAAFGSGFSLGSGYRSVSAGISAATATWTSSVSDKGTTAHVVIRGSPSP